jgi:hypothetical protein
MALDVNQLSAALVQVFQDGQDATSSDQVAQALAQAIHTYVSAGAVNGVVVNVVDLGNNPIGTGTQTQPVAIT